MQKHVYSMFPVLSSPLNHTQKNQNKVMPLAYRVEFENKIQNIEKYNLETGNNVIKSNVFSKGIGINYIHSYNYYQQANSGNNNSIQNQIKTKSIINIETGNENLNGITNINRKIGWRSRENRFFSLSIMRYGGGCGCG